jgi:hypothetical protein
MLEMEDELKGMKAEDYRNRFRIQLDMQDKKQAEAVLTIESLK